MAKADLKCFGCGGKGHFESECPNTGIDATGKPPWCGICDERTRLVDLGEKMKRCTTCHPLRHKQLKQNRICPLCHATVYETDTQPCGNHEGPNLTDRRPERETIQHIVSTT
jgi:hypothetical protein